MKRIILTLVTAFLCVGLFAKGESMYYYMFDKQVKTVSKYSGNTVVFEKGQWFYEPFYIASPEAYGEIELDGCLVDKGYHLITEEEYNSMTKGKDILKDQKKFLGFARNVYPMKNKSAWKAGENYNPRYFPITLNFWMLLLFFLPFFIPVAILVWLEAKCEKAPSPSTAYAWLAILTVALEAVIVYFYGQMLRDADFTNVTVAKFWIIVLLGIAFLGVVIPCMGIKSATKDLYGVRFSGLNIIAFLGIWFLVGVLGGPLLVYLTGSVLHLLPEDSEKLDIVMYVCVGIGLLSALVYMWRELRKQTEDATELMLPLLLLAIVSCGLLPFVILGFLLNAVSKDGGRDAAPSSNKEQARVCSNCSYYDGRGCRWFHEAAGEPGSDRVIAPDQDTCGHFNPK